jgi:hypothetical protein
MRTHRPARLVVAAVATVLLLSACGGSPTSSGGGDQGGEGAATVDYTELERLSVEELTKRAKEEGQLDLYTSMTADVADAVAGAFEDEYDISVNLYRASSETVLQRILQEQQANFQGNDVVETNATEMFALEKEGRLAAYNGAPRQAVAEAGVFPGVDGDPLQPVRAELEHQAGQAGPGAEVLGGAGRPPLERQDLHGDRGLRLVPHPARLLGETGQDSRGSRAAVPSHGQRRQDRQGAHRPG